MERNTRNKKKDANSADLKRLEKSANSPIFRGLQETIAWNNLASQINITYKQPLVTTNKVPQLNLIKNRNNR